MLKLISPSGNELAFTSLENIADNTRFGLERAHYRSGKTIIKKFNEQVLAKNKTGIIYIRKDSIGRRRRHQAAADGESPANRTGFYRKSGGFIVSGPKQLVIGDSAPYAGFLETGTKRMGAKPGLLNAIRSSEKDILNSYTAEIQDAL